MAEIKVVTIDGLTYYHGKVVALLDKKVDKVEGKQLSTEDFTTELKTKLEGVADGAQVNVIESVQVNGTALTVTDKAVNVDLSAYATKEEVSALPKFAIVAVDELPTEDISSTTIYLVPNTGSGTNARDEYIYVNGAWELIGTLETDLSNYYTKSEVDAAIDADCAVVDGRITTEVATINAALETKVNVSDLVAMSNAEIDALFA